MTGNLNGRGRLPRVVQIGYHKCGTRSFQQLFERAGHQVVQHTLRRPFRRKRNAALIFRDNLHAGRKVFSGMEDFTLYAGLIYQTENDSFEPIHYFREILRDYPDTVLLLNVRNREDWIRSRLKHGHGEFARRVMRQKRIPDLDSLADLWRREWDAHIIEVRSFMAMHDKQFIEFNLDSGSVQELVDRLPDYRLNVGDWGDVGRTRGKTRHPVVANVKRMWALSRWRSTK